MLYACRCTQAMAQWPLTLALSTVWPKGSQMTTELSGTIYKAGCLMRLSSLIVHEHKLSSAFSARVGPWTVTSGERCHSHRALSQVQSRQVLGKPVPVTAAKADPLYFGVCRCGPIPCRSPHQPLLQPQCCADLQPAANQLHCSATHPARH